MSAWGLQLITAVIEADDPREALESVLDFPIREDMLLNLEAREVFSWVRSWYERREEFGQVPSRQRVQERFRTLALPPPQEALKDLCRAVRDEYLRGRLKDLHDDLMERLDSGEAPLEALEHLKRESLLLDECFIGDEDAELAGSSRDIVAKHLQDLRENAGLLGIPWPWKEMNEATQGLQEGESVLIYGLRKSMKTWIVLYIATHFLMSGYKVLFLSQEMRRKIVGLRMVSIVARLDYHRVRHGHFTAAEMLRLFKALDYLEGLLDKQSMWFTRGSKADGSAGGITDVLRKVRQYRPNVIILDSAYLLANDRAKGGDAMRWQDLAAIGQDIKRLGVNTKIPVIFVWQENERSAAKFTGRKSTGSLAMATQIAYDVDLAMQVVLDDKKHRVALWFKCSREFEHDGLVINARPGYDFSFLNYDLFESGDLDTGKKQKPGGIGVPKDLDDLAATFSSIFTKKAGDEPA